MERIRNNITNILVCLVLFIMGVATLTFCNFSIKIRTENYDYSQIFIVKGTILEITAKNDCFYCVAELEDKTTLNVYMGDSLKFAVGDKIPIYTDGKYYELTEDNCFFKSSNVRYYVIIKAITMIFLIFLYLPICLIIFVLNQKDDEEDTDDE